MPEKYFAFSDIKKDLEWLRSAGCNSLELQEIIERLEYTVPAADVVAVDVIKDDMVKKYE